METGEPTDCYYPGCLIEPNTVADCIAVNAPDVFGTVTKVLHNKRR